MTSEIAIAKAFYESILKSQYLSEVELQNYQGRLLGRLYDHAIANVVFYKNRKSLGDVINLKSSDWRELPFTTRNDVAQRAGAFTAEYVPSQYGEVVRVQSGGSTGKPVSISLSRLEKFARSVLTYRMVRHWEMDPSLDLFMIRKQQAGGAGRSGIGLRKWAYPWLEEDRLGDRIHIDIALPPEQQLDRLKTAEPIYINTLPSSILRLGKLARSTGVKLNVPIVISVAEFLAPEIRKLAETEFGSRLINILSSAESGVIAIECPKSGLLHIQSEAVLVEILNHAGEPCEEGEIGELVVTGLYNYAQPLIRYRSGDYVVPGPRCDCGVKLPTISRVVGRREHMFNLPNGRQALPCIDRVKVTQELDHEEWQLVQVGQDAVEFRHGQPLLEASKWQVLQALLHEGVPTHWQMRQVPNASLPLTSGGKRHFCINESASQANRQL